MDRAPGEGAGGAGGGSSSSSSRATSAGSSPSGSWAARGAGGRRPRGGSHSSPGSVAASPCGAGGRPGGGRRREPALEGVLSKYTNLLQGWQNRYFMLDFESGILQYFVNEQSKSQKPRGALSLAGAIVSLSDEAPHMLVVYSANGEVYKLRAADAKERQCWMTQLQNCVKYHMETNPKSTTSSRSRSLTLLPHGTPNSASPSSQRHLIPTPPTVVTVTHHKSPAAARRSKSQYSGQLHDVREMMIQVEGQQKTLVQAIEALPGSGPITALDQDLLLLKATSAATLSCLGECLNLLQQSVHQVGQSSHRTGPSENLGWHGPKSYSTDQLKNGALCSLPSSSANVTWAALPNSSESKDGKSEVEPEAEEKEEVLSLPSSYSSYHNIHPSTSPSQQLTPQLSSSDIFFPSSSSVIQKEPKIETTPVEGEEDNHALPSEYWSSYQFQHLNSPSRPPTPQVSTSQVFLPSTSSVIQKEPKIETTSETILQKSLSDEEETDPEDNGDDDLSEEEDHRSIVLHLISQLRFGMDLTKVMLPTFILEKRSLLEMFANFMAHPDLLLSIGSGTTPEDRAISFVEYYLTSFHEGRKGSVAKKPYNPIIGETFHCSWDIPKDKVKPLQRDNKVTESPTSGHGSIDCNKGRCRAEYYKLRFVAEQVSHHPPVTCFYCECKERRMFVNTHVWTKSKFMGMSVGVSLVGEGILRLLDFEEDYVFTLPGAYARSILTIPWVELGGKVTMDCAKTGYSALVTFHTKPFYGGKVHRVTAEVKHNPTNTVVCKAQGEWNGVLEFTYSSGETKVVNTATLPVYPKKVRPIGKQGPMESRHLWQEVSNAMKVGDMTLATEYKKRLEEKQRQEEQQRIAQKTDWQPKYFIKEGDGWMYTEPLLKAQ